MRAVRGELPAFAVCLEVRTSVSRAPLQHHTYSVVTDAAPLPRPPPIQERALGAWLTVDAKPQKSYSGMSPGRVDDGRIGDGSRLDDSLPCRPCMRTCANSKGGGSGDRHSRQRCSQTESVSGGGRWRWRAIGIDGEEMLQGRSNQPSTAHRFRKSVSELEMRAVVSCATHAGGACFIYDAARCAPRVAHRLGGRRPSGRRAARVGVRMLRAVCGCMFLLRRPIATVNASTVLQFGRW